MWKDINFTNYEVEITKHEIIENLEANLARKIWIGVDATVIPWDKNARDVYIKLETDI